MSEIYKIEILNWDKYNQKKKKGMECIMLSCRFFDDAKVSRLTAIQRLIYIRLLTVAGDFTSRHIEVHPEMIARSTGVKRQMIARSIIALQENQLVRLENLPSFNKRIEKKRREEKRQEKNFILNTPSGKDDTEMKQIVLTDQRSAPHKKLIEIWNTHRGGLPEVKTISPTREKKMKLIWPRLVETEWIQVVKKLAASDFCNGKNDRGWKADFDFLVKPDTYSRTLEGRYDNRAGVKNGMTADGLYLTEAVKRSHNNKVLFEKFMNMGKEENEEPRDVGPDLSDR